MARQKLTEIHADDKDGNPAGGATYGCGIAVTWQKGALGRGKDRLEPNGAFVEDVIRAALGRLEYYQEGKFSSECNIKAIESLKEALSVIIGRTEERESREVEGTHEV